MTADTSIPVALLCNQNLLHYILERRLDGTVPSDLPDIDNMSFTEACERYAANAFRQESGYTDNESFLFRWEHFKRHFPRMQCEGVVLAAMQSLYEDFLEERRGNIHVRLERYGEWQNLVANVNLGPIAAYAAHKASSRVASWTLEERELVREAMLNSNALCYPYDVLVEDYIARKGLNDAHLHINACTFAEFNWLQAICDPERAYNPFSLKDGKLRRHSSILRAVRQQFCDIYGRNPAFIILQHLRIARNLRILLREYACMGLEERNCSCLNSLRLWVERKTEQSIICLKDLASDEITCKLIDWKMPWEDHAKLIRQERDWMSRLIRQMTAEDFKGHGAWLLPCLHAYLLLMNEYCGLFIQRETQTGFDQFKNTSRLKHFLKYDIHYYEACFKHFHGTGPQSEVHYLDARIAPRNSVNDYLDQFSYMLRDYARYLAKEIWKKPPHVWETPMHIKEAMERIPEAKPEELLELIRTLRPEAPIRYLQLGVTIHFIKSEWSRKEEIMRYRRNRETLSKQCGVLKALLQLVPQLADILHSVDAASDECCVPPAVFAPCFRFCRRELGMERITFHCGECFPHLLTGLRLMDDALHLLELRDGDRLGHGTALGMDPTYWREQLGEYAYLRMEDRMLDLLYAHEILKHNRQIPGHVCEKFKDELMALAHKIFPSCDRHIDPHVLKAAMDMRDLCPFTLERIFKVDERTPACIEAFKRDTKKYLGRHDIDIWQEGDEIGLWANEAELERTIRRLRTAPTHAILLLLDWQFDKHTWNEGDKIVRVELSKEDDELLLTLQRHMMQKYYSAKVVIETLITSNLRIACYRRAADHHAIRWLLHQPEKFKGEPDLLLCFGSDDPAIFSCDAKADFYLLYASLHEQGIKEHDALRLLDCVNKRGRIYSFPTPKDPLRPPDEDGPPLYPRPSSYPFHTI